MLYRIAASKLQVRVVGCVLLTCIEDVVQVFQEAFMQDLGVVEEEYHFLALKTSLLEHTLEVLSRQKEVGVSMSSNHDTVQTQCIALHCIHCCCCHASHTRKQLASSQEPHMSAQLLTSFHSLLP